MSAEFARSPKAYRDALDMAMQYAGSGDGKWNMRFLNGLNLFGLCLCSSIQSSDQTLYPDGGFPYTAPIPADENPDEWPHDSLVVWKPIKSQ